MIKNKQGYLSGYGNCQECGDTWNWKKIQNINYEDTSGMFPLCIECFKRLSLKKIEEHRIALMVEWGYCENRIKDYLPRKKKEIKRLKPSQKTTKAKERLNQKSQRWKNKK